MFRPLVRSHRRPHRRGTSFTLIVVVMISFAAAVGTAFALFAGQTLRISRANLEGQGGGALPVPRTPEPASAVNRFFGSLIYGVNTDSNEDLTNALRGHDIARSIYGLDPSLPPGQFSTTPWAGVGTFREGISVPLPGGQTLTGDRSAVVNYTQMAFGPTGSAVPFLLDPEIRGLRTFTGNTRGPLTVGPGREYVGKHAGYSFPDLKDFFAGALDPATGQVLVPSFHRPWLWNTTAGTTTFTLDPNNPNWTNNEGRLKTLRPRPAEHPNFPRVPPNADGTYTGDVQNWPGGYTFVFDQANPNDTTQWKFFAKNDSLWMHIGLPPVQFGNRKLQPLVAPLIVPLDGLLNASAHGNIFGPNGAHVSHTGYGPWEVNLAALLGTDWTAVVNARGPAQQRNGVVTARAYHPYSNSPLPAYSPVAWNGNQVARWTYPATNSLSGQPVYPAAPNDYQSNNAVVNNHPSLFSPAEWTANSTPARTFPLSDVKRMHLRYAFAPDWYLLSDLATTAPNALRRSVDAGGNELFPFTFASSVNTEHRYRLDPVHANRALVTTRGFGLDRPKVAPNFVNRDGANALNFGADNKAAALFTTPSPFPAPGVAARGTTFSDFPSDTRWVNQMAALGSVDLNRPLADYRVNPNRTLAFVDTTGARNVTPASSVQADNDRRKLAHDIFVRLAAATGAGLQISLTGVEYPQYQYTVPPGLPAAQFNALRYLAQLAVNVVDFRDDDDISTAFVWNPITPGDPMNAANFGGAEIGNRVVFGFEKPRVVINEVYSEITNNPADRPQGNVGDPELSPARIKFWAELLNPSNTANPNANTSGTPVSPLDDAVSLAAYQIEIARASRLTGLVPPPATAEDTVAALSQPNNITGEFGPTPASGVPDRRPDARFTIALLPTAARTVTDVSPNDNTYTPPPATPFLHSKGIVLVAPPEEAVKPGAEEFNTTGSTVWTAGNTVRSPALDAAPTAAGANPSPGMGYTLPLAGGATLVPGTAEFRRHVVTLRRLANPYIPLPNNGITAADNPFITTDVMDYVPSFDAVHRLAGLNDRRSGGAGYDPVDDRFAVGKVQAYAGHSAATPVGPRNYNSYTFPNSMVLNQTAADATGSRSAPRNTFGRHNGNGNAAPANTFVPGATATLANNERIMTPFDWFVHPDRTLVNQIELFQVRDTPSHRVTDQFLLSGAAPSGVNYESGFARWTQTNNGIARALEYLTVKPFTAGVAHGGRVPGRVSVNALPDQRVLNAVLDPQPGNFFDAGFVNTNAWAQWMGSRNARTVGAVDGVANNVPLASLGTANVAVAPGQSIYDGPGGGTNRPFLSFGAPAVNGPGTFAYSDPNYTTDEQTILRSGTIGAPPALYTGFPVNGTVTAFGATSVPPEPVRKILNNVTPVNHTYVVFLTVSYFEIDGTVDLGGGVTMPRLAHEAGVNLPGDMRQKFIGVIDMSNMAIDPTTSGQAATPFFTTLEQTARPGAPGATTATLNIGYAAYTPGSLTNQPQLFVTAEGQQGPGQPFQIVAEVPGPGGTPGTQLVLGYGVDQQLVIVTGIDPTVAGQITVRTATGGAFRTAWGGSSVSNAVAGYPGPQPGFRYNDPTFKPVLAFLERVR